MILQDLRRHVKIIADFLELKPSEYLMDEIAHNCEFQTMSAFKNNHIPESMCKITDVRDKHIMYRKGDFFFRFHNLFVIKKWTCWEIWRTTTFLIGIWMGITNNYLYFQLIKTLIRLARFWKRFIITQDKWNNLCTA